MSAASTLEAVAFFFGPKDIQVEKNVNIPGGALKRGHRVAH